MLKKTNLRTSIGKCVWKILQNDVAVKLFNTDMMQASAEALKLIFFIGHANFGMFCFQGGIRNQVKLFGM